jgi:hypothetical protein
VCAAVIVSGCSSSSIRKLTDAETEYFSKLKSHLQESTPKLQGLLEKRTALNEEAALLHVAQLDDNIRRAKLVYSLREVLTAPAGNNAPFVQATRNKVILYHLAEDGQASNKQLAAELAKGDEKRKQLISDLNELNKLVSDAIASNEVLHNYLNQSGTSALMDFITEVGRQITAFNEGIKTADQHNNAIQRMVEAGKLADQRRKDVEDKLLKFIDVWSTLNNKKK